jgi:RimJ/RimL family protein N-acetyltransferase
MKPAVDDLAVATLPTLETGRLELRVHRLEDFPDCAALWGDAEATRYIGGKPSTAEEVWWKVLRNVGHWSLLGFGYWVVREKVSGRFIGEVGLADYKRDLQPPLRWAPEAGWMVAPREQGKGFATEAVRAVLAWGEAHFGSTRSMCMISPDNLPSLRVAEKCGYTQSLVTTYKTLPTIILER